MSTALGRARDLAAQAGAAASLASLLGPRMVALSASAGALFKRALRSWAYTTPTYVNSTSADAQASASSIASPALAVTAGNLLVVTVAYSSYATTCTLADSAGNEWIALPRYQNGATILQVHTFYAWDCKGDAANVVTATFGASVGKRMIAVTQYAGADVSADPYVTHAATAGSAINDTTYTSTGLAAARGGILYGGLAVNNVYLETWDPGDWTAASGEAQREDNQSIKVFDRIFDNPGTYDLAFTRQPGDSTTLSFNFVTALFLGRREAGVYARTLSAVAGAVGALRRLFGQAVNGTSGASGALFRARLEELEAAVSGVGSVGQASVLARVLDAGAGAAGAVTREVRRGLSAVGAASGVLLRGFGRALSASSLALAVLSTLSGVTRELVAAAGATASAAWIIARRLTVATVAALGAGAWRAIRVTQAARAAVGATALRQVAMLRTATASAAGTIGRLAGTILAAVVGAASMLSGVPGKVVAAAVGASAGMTGVLHRVLAVGAGVAPRLSRRVSLVLAAVRAVRARLYNGLEVTVGAVAQVGGSLWWGAASVGNLLFRLVVRAALLASGRGVDPAVGADHRIDPAVGGKGRVRDE